MAGTYLGDFPTSATVYVYFDTFASTGASVTISNFAVTDIEIYKDGSVTQRSSDAGYTLLDTDGIDFDGTTGIHGFSIDTSDNTDAGFYAAGHEYTIVVGPLTCDSQTINFVAAHFSIERSGGALALLKNASYGLAQLVRSTTPGNTLTVDASNQALALTNAITAGASPLRRLRRVRLTPMRLRITPSTPGRLQQMRSRRRRSRQARLMQPRSRQARLMPQPSLTEPSTRRPSQRVLSTQRLLQPGPLMPMHSQPMRVRNWPMRSWRGTLVPARMPLC